MSLFGRYSEEDFLDEDEKRLRRESARRAREAHKKCAADHMDDGRFQIPTNPLPHTDCKADHTDDGNLKPHTAPNNGTYRTPNYGNATRPNSYGNPNPNIPRPNGSRPQSSSSAYAVVIIAVVFVTFTAFVSMFAAMGSNVKKHNKSSQLDIESMMSVNESFQADASSIKESVDAEESELMSTFNFNMTQFSVVEEYINTNHTSRTEAIEYFVNESNTPLSQIEVMIRTVENLNRVDFGENAVYVVNAEDPIEEEQAHDESRVREILESHNFDDEDIEYALDHLEIK